MDVIEFPEFSWAELGRAAIEQESCLAMSAYFVAMDIADKMLKPKRAKKSIRKRVDT